MKTYNVILNGTVIGKVYHSSHNVWVAQPSWDNYSCSFTTRDRAIIELMLHYENQKYYSQGKGMPVH